MSQAIKMESGPREAPAAGGRLPTFLGIGAAKSGTTSLYNYLVQHPQVYMSPIKEPNHFSRDIDPESFRRDYKLHERQKRLDVDAYVRGEMKETHWGAYVQDPEHYRALFRNARPEDARGEISNSYLYSRIAAREISRVVPDARLFAILRNPVERAWSHYLANLRDGRAIRPFREEIEADLAAGSKEWGQAHLYVELGMYAEQVRRFQELFPPDQLRVYLYDDLRADPESLVRDLFRFVGVDPDVQIETGVRHNAARIPRHPRLVYLLSSLGIKKRLFRLVPASRRQAVKGLFFRKGSAPRLDPADRAFLLELFRDDIRRLESLTGRDLGAWLEV